jgi:hypothetical protein
MLIYVDEIQREVDDILAYAGLVRKKFDARRNAAELLLDAKALDAPHRKSLRHVAGRPDDRQRAPAHAFHDLLP